MKRRYRRRIQRGDMAGIGSAPRGRKNYEIREHAKSRDWKRATRLCLRQSLFQSQRVSPDFYFFQASFRSRLNHPYPRAERDSEKALRCFLVSSSRKIPHKYDDRPLPQQQLFLRSRHFIFLKNLLQGIPCVDCDLPDISFRQIREGHLRGMPVGVDCDIDKVFLPGVLIIPGEEDACSVGALRSFRLPWCEPVEAPMV